MSGLKPKSRWYFRSELETSPSSSTHSTSDVVRTTVVAVVPADMTPNPNLNMNNNCLDENSTKTPTDGGSTFYAPPPPPLPPFEPITENIYFDKSKKGQRSNRMICECSYDEAVQSGYGCRDECLNRVLYYECGSNCPCSSLCSNRRFQNRQYSYVEPFPAGDKGYGLRAVNAIPANSFVIEYVGEVLTPNQFENRKKQYAKDTTHKHHYFMALKSDQVIDATRKGNVSRFINHSCDPNCQTQKWAVCGQLRIGFFTIKNVQAGEELTFDYRFQRYGKEAQRCYCGSVSCRGFIGVDGKERKNNIEKEEKRKEKTVFEDALFDREFEDMIALGSLKNKDQVVTFGRLVLRAEGFDSRRQLLDLLTNTEKHVLRLFLDLHGCRLLWSWAVDETGCGENFRNLQTKLLEILKILPIPHQNMLRESRVLSVVERWANGGCRKLPISAKSSSKPTNSDEDIFDCVKKTLMDLVDRVCSPFSSSPAESEVAASFDIDSKDSLCYENNISTENIDEIVSKSLALLQQWSLLKENFKIPKRSGEKEEKSPHDKKSANLSSTTSVLNKSKGSSSDLKKSVTSETKKHLPIKSVADSGRSSNRRDRHNNKSRSRSRSRSRDKYTSSSSSYHHRSSAYGRYRNSKPSQSPPPYHRNNSRFDINHRKRPSSPSGGDTKRSKEERRRAFEESVAREDERKQMKEFSDTFNAAAEDVAVQQQQQQQNHQTPYWDHSGVGSTPMSSSTIYDPNSSSMAVPPAPVPVPPPTAAQAALPAVLVHDHVSSKYWWRDQSTGILVYPASDQQVASVENHDLSVVPHFLHDASTGYIHEIQMPVQEPAPSAYAAQDDRNEVDMVCEDDSMTRDQRINLLREQIATLQSQMDQKQKELQWLLEQEETTSSPVRSPPSRPPSRLPPDWKTALDPNGKVYYYHSITKKTQWEPPSWVEPLSPALSPKKSKSPLPKQQQRDRRSSSSHAKSSSRAKPTMTSSSSSRDHHRRRRSSSHHRSSSSHHRHQQNSSRSNAAPSGSGGSGKDRGEQQRKMKAALKIKNAAFPKKSSIKTTSAQVQKMAAKSKAVEKEKLQKKIIEQQLKLLLQQHQPVAAAAAVEASTSSFAAMKTTPPPATVTSMPHFVPIPALVKEEPIADEQSSFEVTPFGTTTAAADTSSEVARKFKESFKTSVSNYVIKCLSSYRKTECKLGRITNNEDFKHLARKLTHAIMEKELKHCRGLEDLRVTDSVLHKAKAYIKHYMAKLGAVYKRTVGGSP